jgi:hypothetical protein
MMKKVCVKTKSINLPLLLLGLIILILFTLSGTQPIAAQTGFEVFESCDVQNGRDENGIPYPNEIPASECEALVSFYNSTNGPNWTDNTGWLTYPPCMWLGVFCLNGHVRALDLFYRQLSGSIPPQIGDLTYLDHLNLGDNQLIGGIPPQIGNLTKLQSLYLHINQLSGNIPPQIGNLTGLQRLWLHNNRLSGDIPPQISNLINLQDLWLHINELSGSIPPQIGNLTNLRRLYLYRNQLSGNIPPQIGNLTNLQDLELNINLLSSSIPSQIGNLTNLQYLWMNNNHLSGELPASLTNLRNLDRFTIDYTCLTEPQDAAFQGWLDTITYFVPNTHSRPECPCLETDVTPKYEEINNFGECGVGNTGAKIPIWGSFGEKEVLEAHSGEKLRVVCNPSSLVFELLYTPSEGNEMRVGMCPFDGGSNTSFFFYIDNNTNDDKPDCFVGTRWISRDYWYNDGGEIYQGTGLPFEQNLWTGEKPESPELLDWADSLFDVKSNHVYKIDHKFEYIYEQPIPLTPSPPPEGRHITSTIVNNPPIWPATFSTNVTVQQSLTAPVHMVENPFQLCDFDNDGDCDEVDFQFFQERLGACWDDTNYHPIADLDGDRCVTLTDQQYLFPVAPGQNPIYLPIILKNMP